MRISIITPTNDEASFVDEAIASVPCWPAGEVEHIVVHDGREAFAAALQARHPSLKILKGPGRGPTPAIVQGFAAATGDFLIELNSDDRLTKDAFDALQKSAAAKPDIRLWTGGTRIFRTEANGREVALRTIRSPHVTSVTLANLFDDLPLVNARFIHRSVFAEIGNMDPRFPESCDREFMIRAAVAGVGDAPLGIIVSELREHAGSHTMHRSRGAIPPYLKEHLRVADMWLSRSDLSAANRRAFRNWRAREALRLLVYELRAGSWREAAQDFAAAVTLDPAWGLRIATTPSAWRRRRRS
jgi:hypothetical protein